MSRILHSRIRLGLALALLALAAIWLGILTVPKAASAADSQGSVDTPNAPIQLAQRGGGGGGGGGFGAGVGGGRGNAQQQWLRQQQRSSTPDETPVRQQNREMQQNRERINEPANDALRLREQEAERLRLQQNLGTGRGR